MKKSILLGVALCTLAGTQAQWGKKIKGNGNMQTMDRTTADYEAVAVSGFFDVVLVAGKEGTITVRADENLQEYILTEVDRGQLEIKIKKGVNIQPSSWKDGILVTVPIESINSVSLSGSGDIKGKTPIKSESFSTHMSGSGDIELEVIGERVSASMSGSGDMSLKGQAQHFSVEISGSGDVTAYDLEAEEVDATISGSANIEVTANQVLKARVSGSGDINYRGNPSKIDSKASGSGDISKG